ncbi:uncharacterized protein MONBRDRAFT_24030 [Monosiga brevicollis MX1]|uniref:Uncharacterized protein n=1 Tax=Monosiga brevicollis TaxID=81824 RepID=A9UUH8_MONBE|nr:uncharacterized protein MONBRDRAFT_24030 [Monosiga brevicollis MX1]EDQ91099.1 predicted protein [Monosiga brevicollis MX1]|eukprot:XP_001744396.1 hypothetical protein [Monosiga brevicollis MX1]
MGKTTKRQSQPKSAVSIVKEVVKADDALGLDRALEDFAKTCCEAAMTLYVDSEGTLAEVNDARKAMKPRIERSRQQLDQLQADYTRLKAACQQAQEPTQLHLAPNPTPRQIVRALWSDAPNSVDVARLASITDELLKSEPVNSTVTGQRPIKSESLP